MSHETEVRPSTDKDLVERTRLGDMRAYGELWRRYADAGRAAARGFTTSYAPDDLVSEAYVRILRSIQAGGGPTTAFRAYLVTTIRNVAISWHRSKTSESLEDADLLPDPVTEEGAVLTTVDKEIVGRAYRALPERWQQILWFTEMEGLKPRDIAPKLGLSANSVSALALRAREGLREAWIQAHLQSPAPGPEHQWTIERLGAYARGSIGKRDRIKIADHLQSCPSCAAVAAEAGRVARVLPWALVPLLGGGTVASWLAPGPSASAAERPADRRPASRPDALLVAIILVLVLVVGVAGIIAVVRLQDESPSRPPAAAQEAIASDGSTPIRSEVPEASESAIDPAPVESVPPSSDPDDRSDAREDASAGSAAVNAPVIDEVDTGGIGRSGVFYPIVSGRASPGAILSVSNGAEAPVKVVANAAGVWRTGQLSGFPEGQNTVSVSQETTSGPRPAPTTASFVIGAPDVQATITPSVGRGSVHVEIVMTTVAQVQVSTSEAGHWRDVPRNPVLADTSWTADYAWTDPTDRLVSFRYSEAGRFGPSRVVQVVIA